MQVCENIRRKSGLPGNSGGRQRDCICEVSLFPDPGFSDPERRRIMQRIINKLKILLL